MELHLLTMNDIIIPLGNGSIQNNLELRYALRSIERNAVNCRKVIIAGNIPDFLVKNSSILLTIKVPNQKWIMNKEARIAWNIMYALKNLDTTDDVVLWNDDYILEKETDITQIPNYRRDKNLEESAESRGLDYYRNSLLKTAEFLKSQGKETQNYDIHCPIIYNKKKFLDLEKVWIQSGKQIYGFVVKSTYGNMTFPEVGPELKDLKLNHHTNEHGYLKEKIQDRWVWSYSDKAFNEGVNNYLRKIYKEKSKYEATPVISNYL